MDTDIRLQLKDPVNLKERSSKIKCYLYELSGVFLGNQLT
jgi:hypothetical protein